MQKDHKELILNLLKDVDFLKDIDTDSISTLSGGVASLILALKTKETVTSLPKQIVLKYTFFNDKLGGKFGHTDLPSLLGPAADTHILDIDILSHLQNDTDIVVPKIYWSDKERKVTVMSDFRLDGYELMQELLVKDALPVSSAEKVGTLLGKLVMKFADLHPRIQQVEDSTTQARERLEELYSFLRPNLDIYYEIENKFLDKTHIIPTDGHPKNIGLDKDGNPIIFDFGRTIVADPQFVAPNFAAHIALGTISGAIKNIKEGLAFIRQFIAAYNNAVTQQYKIEEKWFVIYCTAELLHRGLSGRWIDTRLFINSSLQEVERAVHDIGIAVFRPDTEKHIETIDDLLAIISTAAGAIKKGNYKTRL